MDHLDLGTLIIDEIRLRYVSFQKLDLGMSSIKDLLNLMDISDSRDSLTMPG